MHYQIRRYISRIAFEVVFVSPDLEEILSKLRELQYDNPTDAYELYK